MSYCSNFDMYTRQPFNQTTPSFQTPVYPGQSTQQMQNMPLGLPTGLPTGPSPTPLTGMTSVSTMPVDNIFQDITPAPQTVENVMFIPGFLRTQIGRKVRIEFLIGTSSMVDRLGTLLAVGASYVLIQEEETDDILLCDLYSIKFVRIYR